MTGAGYGFAYIYYQRFRPRWSTPRLRFEPASLCLWEESAPLGGGEWYFLG